VSETLSDLGEGFGAVLAVGPLIAILLGVFIGSLVGALPGIGPVGAMAVLLPLSFSLDPAGGLLMITGIYLGAQYGGSTTSILMRVPGEASSVITAIDGYEMTKRGRAGAALAVAAIASFVAGTLAVVMLMLVAGPVSRLAVDLGAGDFLALTVFALLVLVRVSGSRLAPTMVAASVGLLLATVGIDEGTGATRFTFGSDALLQGLDVTPVAVGLFGLAEILLLVEQRARAPRLPAVPLRDLYPSREELRRALPAIGRGSVLGFLFGLVPGPGGAMSTYASYMLERRLSRHPEQFGAGAVEGVAGPESANNGAVGGSFVPLLVLGIPFSAATALLLAGFTIHGAVPGPLFIENQSALFWSLVAGMYLANVALLVLNLPLVGIFTTVLRAPRDVLVAGILVVAVLGTFATRNALSDVVWLVVMGVVGYVMVKLDLSRPALMLAFVIGPFMESSLRQTLALSVGDPTYLVSRPVAVFLLLAAAAALALPLLRRGRRPAGVPVPKERVPATGDDA